MSSQGHRKRMRAGLLAIAALFLAFLAVRQASVLAFRTIYPDFALNLSPSDPVAVTRKYNMDLIRSGGSLQQSRAAWDQSARSALLKEPLSSGPLQILLRGNGQDQALMRIASKITRRDLAIQLWQIEDAVSRGDIADTLLHYDRALSVHPEAGEILFPVLAGAVSQAEVRRGLEPLLARNRRWSGGFLEYLSAKTEDYPSTIDLFRSYGGSHKVPSHMIYETTLLNRLVGSGNSVMARDFGHWMAGFDVGGPAAFGLSRRTFDKVLLPLSWRLDVDDIVEADFDPDLGLMIRVAPSERGTATSRVVILPPGRWTLDQLLEWEAGMPMADISWTVTCLMPRYSEKITDIRVRSQSGRHTFANDFLVPAMCKAVRFDLMASGPINDGEAGATVKSLSLRPSVN